MVWDDAPARNSRNFDAALANDMCEDGIPHVLLLVPGGAALEDVFEQADESISMQVEEDGDEHALERAELAEDRAPSADGHADARPPCNADEHQDDLLSKQLRCVSWFR
jgi:hypothetical protein